MSFLLQWTGCHVVYNNSVTATLSRTTQLEELHFISMSVHSSTANALGNTVFPSAARFYNFTNITVLDTILMQRPKGISRKWPGPVFFCWRHFSHSFQHTRSLSILTRTSVTVHFQSSNESCAEYNRSIQHFRTQREHQKFLEVIFNLTKCIAPFKRTDTVAADLPRTTCTCEAGERTVFMTFQSLASDCCCFQQSSGDFSICHATDTTTF